MTRLDRGDRRALAAGALVLAALVVLYPLVAEAAARPLAVFVLPALLTAVLDGWRPTVLVGLGSLAAAVVLGLAGPLDAQALAARWIVVGIGVLMGAIGAAVREGQSGRLADLDEAMSLREAFERALVPPPVVPPGYVAVSRYRPAEARMRLGGDFVEAVALADGRLAVLIGDVCGHGPREAAFGAALRAGWKSIALGTTHDPVEWMSALDTAFFQDGRIDTYVTICTGFVDRQVGTSCFVNAGHPPPVLLRRPALVLDVPPSPPLGIGRDYAWKATEVPWDGGPLLFYTDGLIENPCVDGAPRRWGLNGLLSWLETHPLTATAAAVDALVTAATAHRDIRDDIALLVVAADR